MSFNVYRNDALFRKSGLLACDDEALLDTVVDGLRFGLLASAPLEFIRYFERQLMPLYQENVAVSPGFNKWTNNTCESENHVLKQAVKWKPKQLPDLSIVYGHSSTTSKPMLIG